MKLTLACALIFAVSASPIRNVLPSEESLTATVPEGDFVESLIQETSEEQTTELVQVQTGEKKVCETVTVQKWAQCTGQPAALFTDCPAADRIESDISPAKCGPAKSGRMYLCKRQVTTCKTVHVVPH